MDTIYTAATQTGDIPAGALFFIIVLYIGIFALSIWIYGRIVSKAGYPWWWVLIMVVPIAGLVFLCLFAFKEWPIERELRETRAALQMSSGGSQRAGRFGGEFGGQAGSQFGGQIGGQFGSQQGGQYGGSSNQPGMYDGGSYRQQPPPTGNPYEQKY